VNVVELVEAAVASGDPRAIALAHKLLKTPSIYQDDPTGYCRNVLGVDLWEKQAEVAEALVTHRRVLVESANAIGKSFTAACLAIWFHECFDPGIVLLTAPTARQISDIVFREIRQLYRGPGLYPKLPRIERSPDHLVHGFTATDSTAFQGIHGRNVLIIFDEATGVAPEFWEAAEGILVGGQNVYFLAVCNPTDTSSQAYLARQTGRWHTISISAFDHPNIDRELNGLPPLIPGAIRLEQLRALIQEWCQPVAEADHEPIDFEFEGRWYRPGPVAEARLLGRYPSQGSYSIFAERDFDATLRELEPHGQVEIGCFVAGTLVDTATGRVPIEQIKVGDRVLTRSGYQRVKAAACTGIKPTFTLTCEDGRTLTGTADHPLWDGEAWRSLASFKENDILCTWNTSNTTASFGTEIPSPSGIGIEGTTSRPLTASSSLCTGTCGKSSTGRFRKARSSTTRTETRPTTTSLTWSVSRRPSTRSTTASSTASATSLPPGTRATRGGRGTKQWPSKGDRSNRWSATANNAASNTPTFLPHCRGSAPTSASVRGDEKAELTTNNAFAVNAARSSHARNTSPRQLVPARVLTNAPGGLEKVYNLTVENCPEYFANGILVHNCDVARFGDDSTTIHVQQGGVSLYHEAVNRRDTAWVAARLKELADRFGGDGARTIPIRIDSTGIGGGVVDQRGDYHFIEVNASQTASDEEKYPNVRSELLFSAADHMRQGKMSLAGLFPQQVAEIRRQALGITYKLDAKGRRVAERKDEIKKRIGRSPDDLDALTLAYLGRPNRFDLGRVLDVFVAAKPTKEQIEQQQKVQTTNVEDDMAEVLPEYKNVFYLAGYGTYQARPLVNNIPVPLVDYPRQHEAALAVELTHMFLGTASPHTVPQGRVPADRQKIIEAEVEKRLRERKLYPVATPKPKKKAEIESK
jgi:hypothetical protein